MKCVYVFIVSMFLWVGTAAAQDGAWYRGDLHAHSDYSDGDSPVEEVIAAAAARGLDFFVITDHDILLGGETPHWEDAGYVSDELLLLYGVEWTTLRGHANVWLDEPFDYSGLWEAFLGGDAAASLAEAHRLGALFSINHPLNYTCCPWLYGVPEGVDSIEVWNGLYRAGFGNRATQQLLWDELLQQGRRITGVGGSDTHRLQGPAAELKAPGNPTTWVYAAERSGAAVLDGIRAGAVSISCAPDAVRLELWADSDGDGSFETMMGAAVAAGNEPVVFKLVCALPDGASDAQLQQPRRAVVRKNGRFFSAFTVGAGEKELLFSDRSAAGDYYRVELWGASRAGMPERGLQGRLRALTNPIYFY